MKEWDAATPKGSLPRRAGEEKKDSVKENAKKIARAKMSRPKKGFGPTNVAGGKTSAMGGGIAPMLLALSLLFAVPARATTYYVASNIGNDTFNGTAATTPWKTIGHANGAISAGDVVLLLPGQYADMPGIASATENASHTYFYGNIADPTTVKITATQIKCNHTTIAGVTFTKGFVTNNQNTGSPITAYRDTIRDFISGTDNSGTSGSISLECANYDVFLRGQCHGSSLLMGRHDNGPAGNSVGDLLSGCTFTSLGFGVVGSSGLADIHVGGNGGRLDSCTISFNDFTMRQEAGVQNGGANLRSCYLMTHTTWKHNWYHVTVNSASGGYFFLYDRDSSSFNTYRADSAVVVGPGGVMIEMPARGAFNNSCTGVVMDSCSFLFKNTGHQDFGPAQDYLNNFTMTYTTILALTAPAWKAFGLRGKCKFDHDTFAGYPGNFCGDYGGVVVLDGESLLGGDRVCAYTDTVQFTNNILYPVGVQPSAPVRIDQCWCGGASNNGCFQWAVRYSLTNMDSVHAAGGGVSRMPKFNWNLFSCYSDSVATGDHSIRWVAPWTTLYGSAPGSNTTISSPPVSWLFRYQKIDSASVYGSPQFVDSTVATFDPHLLSTSAAIGKGNGGTDMGAVAYATYSLMTFNSLPVSFVSGVSGKADFTINNIGSATLNISAGSSITGFTYTSLPGTISAGQSAKITVTYDGSVPASANQDGEFSTGFTITSDSRNSTVQTVLIHVYGNASGQISP